MITKVRTQFHTETHALVPQVLRAGGLLPQLLDLHTGSSKFAHNFTLEFLLPRFCALEGFYPNSSNVLRMLGYFSLVGLLRVHTLIGDYHSGLKGERGCMLRGQVAAAIRRADVYIV